MAEPLLVDLAYIKGLLDIPNTDTTRDAQITEHINAASLAVINYTQRDFGSSTVTEDRTFRYNGGGILEIDDCAAVNSVAINNSALNVLSWLAQPDRGPVYTWLELPPYDVDPSGAMGFTYNLDRFMRYFGVTRYLNVTVNADWGWPDVPSDVQQAVTWTVLELYRDPRRHSGQVTAESIAEYSITYDSGQQQITQDAIPNRAYRLLDPYIRTSL